MWLSHMQSQLRCRTRHGTAIFMLKVPLNSNQPSFFPRGAHPLPTLSDVFINYRLIITEDSQAELTWLIG